MDRLALIMQFVPEFLDVNVGPFKDCSYPFTWSYTNAGRRSTQTDPYTGAAVPHPAGTTPPASTYAAKQWTYDPNGDVGSLSLPVVGRYTQMTHDVEGGLSGYAVQPSQKATPPRRRTSCTSSRSSATKWARRPRRRS